MSELPLFPLQTVLLPDGLLALRVFEPRYVDMVARCLRGANRFGVVAIREGAEVGASTTYDHGTSAEIVDWHQEQAGLLGILAVGREPFRLLATRRERDGLYVGSVEWLESTPAQKLTAAHAPLAALLEKLIEPLPLYRGVETALDDAAWVGGAPRRAPAARARIQAIAARDARSERAPREARGGARFPQERVTTAMDGGSAANAGATCGRRARDTLSRRRTPCARRITNREEIHVSHLRLHLQRSRRPAGRRNPARHQVGRHSAVMALPGLRLGQRRFRDGRGLKRDRR